MQIEKSVLIVLAVSVGAWFVVKPAMEERSYNNEKDVMIGVDRRFGPNSYASSMPQQDKRFYGIDGIPMPDKALSEEPCFSMTNFFFRQKDFISSYKLSGQTVVIKYDNLPTYHCTIRGNEITVTDTNSKQAISGILEKSALSSSTIKVGDQRHIVGHSWPKFSPNGRTYRGVLSETQEGMERMATLFE